MRERERRSALKRELAIERDIIDYCDKEIFGFAHDRIMSAARIMLLKFELGEPVLQPARYTAVLENRRQLADQGGLPPGFAEGYVAFMHEVSVNYQEDVKSRLLVPKSIVDGS